MRYEYGQAMSQDVLGEVEALWADPTVEYPAGWCPCTDQWTEREPSRSYAANLLPPPIAAFLTPEQLDALECDHRLTHPYSHNERVQWLDKVREVTVGLPRVPDTRAKAWELVRLPMLRWGVGVLERVAVNIIAQAIDGEGLPVGEPIPVGSLLGPSGLAIVGVDPCPFPIPHPVAGGAPLSIRFHLLNYRHSRRVRDEPPLLANASPFAIPVGDNIVTAWRDMRYRWGSRYSEGNQWVRGGHSLIRFFMVVETGMSAWTLRVCARLSGYVQQAGRDGAALRSALVRH